MRTLNANQRALAQFGERGAPGPRAVCGGANGNGWLAWQRKGKRLFYAGLLFRWLGGGPDWCGESFPGSRRRRLGRCQWAFRGGPRGGLAKPGQSFRRNGDKSSAARFQLFQMLNHHVQKLAIRNGHQGQCYSQNPQGARTIKLEKLELRQEATKSKRADPSRLRN